MAMANRNIQIKKRRGSLWDNLFPITLSDNVFDESGNTVKQQISQSNSELETTIQNLTNTTSIANEANAKASNPLAALSLAGYKIPLEDLSNEVKDAFTGTTGITTAKGFLENNQGVLYPLKNLVLDGQLNQPEQSVKDIILSAKVLGAKKDKYYVIEYIAKGWNGYWGLRLAEYDRLNNTNTIDGSTRRLLIDYTKDDAPEPADIIVNRTIELKEENLIFNIVYDNSAVPGQGVAIFQHSGGVFNGRGVGCVIHPDNYNYRIEVDNPLGYFDNNRGKTYPLLNVKRDGIVHPVESSVKNSVLSVRVSGADPNKYYCIEWIGNGFESGGNVLYGFGISSFDRNEDGSFNSDTRNEILLYSQSFFPEPTSDVVSRTVNMGSIVFEITYDRTEFYDTDAFNIARPDGGRGYGCVIHPDNYIYKTTDLSDVTTEQMKFTKTGDEFIVFQKQPSGKFLGYSFRHSKRPYLVESNNSNVDVWSFKDASEYSEEGSILRSFYTNTTQDLMIREQHVNDYMGGDAHGDEILDSVEIYVDGRLIDIGRDVEFNCKEVKMVQITKLYRDTSYTNGRLEHLATARKVHIININGYDLDVTVQFHEALTLRECQIGAISMFRKAGGSDLVKEAIYSGTLTSVDLQEVTSTFDRLPNIKGVYIMGNDATINWQVERKSNEPGNTTWVNTANASLVKLYSSYCENGYVTEVDEVFSQKTHYEYIVS